MEKSNNKSFPAVAGMPNLNFARVQYINEPRKIQGNHYADKSSAGQQTILTVVETDSQLKPIRAVYPRT